MYTLLYRVSELMLFISNL